MRCNRELKDPTALYGWRCALILGLDKASPTDVTIAQKLLNHLGYRDNNGRRLKEDGVYGPKTAYASRRAMKSKKKKLSFTQALSNALARYDEFFRIRGGPGGRGPRTLWLTREEFEVLSKNTIELQKWMELNGFSNYDILEDDWDRETYGPSAPPTTTPLPLLYISNELLQNLGWQASIDEEKLNRLMDEHGITTKELKAHFLAQITYESNNGTTAHEQYEGDSEFDYFRKYSYILGNNGPEDAEKFRGAGYIHLTGKENYIKFANFIGDQEVVNQGWRYVERYYPIEAACWFFDRFVIYNNIEAGDAGIDYVSSVVLGQDNGSYAERRRLFWKALDLLG